MTSEKRILISISELLSVGWDCPHCHTLYSVPLDKLDRDLPAHCPNCSESLLNELRDSPIEKSEVKMLHEFLHFLGVVKAKKFSDNLRLEIRNTENKS